MRRRGRDHRQDLVGGAVGRIFLPADRTERPLQHAADADRVGPEMKVDRALVQGALGLRRAAALAQIIEPGRAVVALGPQFGIGDVARDRPAIGAVALPARAARPASRCGRRARIVLRDAILDLDHQRPAAPRQRQPHLGIGKCSVASSVAGADPAASAARSRAAGEMSIRPAETKQRGLHAGDDR